MKLLNKSLLYLSISLFFIIGIWSFVFYFNMLQEIKGSVDEGLDNYKRQIVFRAQNDATILTKSNLEEGFLAITEITEQHAATIKDTYIDTLLYMQDADDEAPELEPVRMLTTAFELNGNYYQLQIINSMVEEDDLVKELVYDAVWLYLLLVVGILLINNVVLQRLWKPFYSLLQQLKNYRIGSSQNFPMTQTDTKEFADMQTAVHILLQHNIERYEQQKQFIGNAAHELQTPLAIATNKLELMIEKGNLQDDQAENLAEIMQLIERMVRLNKSLLLLTKIENKQFFHSKIHSINDVVHQNISDLEEIATFKQVTITVNENAQLNTEIDAALANIIIGNLLRNAIFHNKENGTVLIEIAAQKLKISNTGWNMPLNNEKKFSRFYKSEQNANSTGLGLAIIKAICDLYQYTITYHFENEEHIFEVQFR